MHHYWYKTLFLVNFRLCGRNINCPIEFIKDEDFKSYVPQDEQISRFTKRRRGITGKKCSIIRNKIFYNSNIFEIK
jgi:hypothetical protein